MKIRCWYAVHGAVATVPPAGALLDAIRPRVQGFEPDFDTQQSDWHNGWFWMFDPAPLPAPPEQAIHIYRKLPGDEGFLGDNLDPWEQELNCPGELHSQYVLSCLRNTRQTVYLRPRSANIGPSRLARICEQLCGCIARASQGLIQVYQEGFFSPEGESLFPSCPRHRLKTR